MRLHPSVFGFRHGLTAVVNGPGNIELTHNCALTRKAKDIVYVALLRPDESPLKVGISSGTLSGRWRGTFGVVRAEDNRSTLTPSEIAFGQQLLAHATGRTIEIWYKEAMVVPVPYATDFSDAVFSARGAEEIFLDAYYKPAWGMRLSSRNQVFVPPVEGRFLQVDLEAN